jgi:hypothetical protein
MQQMRGDNEMVEILQMHCEVLWLELACKNLFSAGFC